MLPVPGRPGWLLAALAAILLAGPAGAADPPDVAAIRAALALKGGARFAAAWLPGAPVELLVEFADAGAGTRAEDPRARAPRVAALKARALGRLAAGDAETLRDYSQLPLVFVRVRSSAALRRLLQLGEVVAVYPEQQLRKHLVESLAQIRQPPASSLGARGNGQSVAVIDTGVDYTRVEFGSCTAPGVPAGCRVPVAIDFAPDDGQRDDDGHGTHTAAVVRGVASGTAILALDVFNGTSASASTIVAALDWVIANRAAQQVAAVNMSLGDGQRYTQTCRNFNPYRTAIQTLRSAGVLTIVSSGNDGYTNGINSPACTPEAVSVGAVYDANLGSRAWTACTDPTTALDQVTCFSNSASFLSLLAPGALITAVGRVYGGTSEAAPHVAGATAVLQAAYPAESAATRLDRLLQGVPVLDPRNGVSRPRLDVLRAVGAVNDALAAAPVIFGTSASYAVEAAAATAEAGEPAHAGVTASRSVWWTWTAPADGTLVLDTLGSSFDTVLAVYTGIAAGSLVPQASNNDSGAPGGASALTLFVTAGTTYRIVVDAATGSAGRANLNVAFTVAPPPATEDIPLPPLAWAALGALLGLTGFRRLRAARRA